jgi:hypothetical protein
MTNGKEKKNIDEYLKEMMGTFTDEEKKEAAKAGLKYLGIEILEGEPKQH